METSGAVKKPYERKLFPWEIEIKKKITDRTYILYKHYVNEEYILAPTEVIISGFFLPKPLTANFIPMDANQRRTAFATLITKMHEPLALYKFAETMIWRQFVHKYQSVWKEMNVKPGKGINREMYITSFKFTNEKSFMVPAVNIPLIRAHQPGHPAQIWPSLFTRFEQSENWRVPILQRGEVCNRPIPPPRGLPTTSNHETGNQSAPSTNPNINPRSGQH